MYKRNSIGQQLYKIKAIYGTVKLRDYNDYDYGTYDISVVKLVPGRVISQCVSTFKTFEYGIPDLFLEYDYEIVLVNGTVLNGNHRQYTLGQLSIDI